MLRRTVLTLLIGIAGAALFAVVAYFTSGRIPLARAIPFGITIAVVLWILAYLSSRRKNMGSASDATKLGE